MNDREDDESKIKERVESFIKSRKSENSIKYAFEILAFLMSYYGDKGVRSIDLMNYLVPKIIPDSATYFRIIKDMSCDKYEIIKETVDHEYTGGGKKPVYYSAIIKSVKTLSMFKTKDEIWHELMECKDKNRDLKSHLSNCEMALLGYKHVFTPPMGYLMLKPDENEKNEN